MDSKNDDSIQVCIRIRPGSEDHSILDYTDTEIHLDRNHFGFDHIFPPSATQNDIFLGVGTKTISHTLQGYNGCVFVYGQTGSGKTYTMMGDNNGLMQRSFVRLFEELRSMRQMECVISCSYYEIYNEQIIDLLDVKKDKEKKMNIRQDLKKGVYVENLTEEVVCNEDKLFQCLSTGMKNRHVGETMMNRESSRSHSIFTINFSMRCENNGVKCLKTPKLHFVDLAGSERQKMTAASGDRLKEAGNINKSLTSLGMVINALACEKTRSHIPYRDSKLTSLLRDSLGGNSKTFLIATVSRNIMCFQETLSTLNFANRAKMVKVKALINEESLSTNIQFYKEEIRKLKGEIQRLKSQTGHKKPNSSVSFQPNKWFPGSEPKVDLYDTQFKQLNEKISVISDHLAKNTTSPSLEVLIQQFQSMKGRDNSGQGEMIDEANVSGNGNGNEEEKKKSEMEEDEQEDALIQYLSCNNSLLQKIHGKIDEYVELKEELRNMAYQNTMNIAELKTPSRFERDQYEDKLRKKEKQIETQQSYIRTLQTLITEQELKMNEQKMDIQFNGGKIEERDEEIQSFLREKSELSRDLCHLRGLLKQTNEDIESINAKYNEAQTQCKENKELYLYVEQNLETEKSLRKQIESNLMEKIDQYEHLSNLHDFKMEEYREEKEELEERFKEEINILSQTIEFNENLISNYTKELSEEKESNSEKINKIKFLENKNADYEREISQLKEMIHQKESEYEEMKDEMRRQRECFEKNIEGLKNIIKDLEANFKTYRDNSSRIINENMENIQKLSENNSNLESMCVSKNKEIDEMQDSHRNTISSERDRYEEEIINLSQYFENLKQEHEKTVQQNSQCIHKLSEEKLTALKELEDLRRALQETRAEYEKELERMKEERKQEESQAKKMNIENEELKKVHKDLLRDNYKLKSKYGENASKTTEELISKVNYYEEKFKLMSIEYQKALEAVKKMKERDVNQAKKISQLEENQKILKINYQNSQSNENETQLKGLKQENMELKRELESMKGQKKMSANMKNKEEYELREKEKEFLERVKNFISKMDCSKENGHDSGSIDELLGKWEEIEKETDKKIEAISKGIKKEQKIKSQNKLIMKENIFLKEQVSQLEKQVTERGGQPRKLVKRSEECCQIDLQ